jgi:hypothetical protein
MDCFQVTKEQLISDGLLERRIRYTYTTMTYCTTQVYMGIENLFTMRDLAIPTALYLPKFPDSKDDKIGMFIL